MELAPPYNEPVSVLASGLTSPYGVTVNAAGDVFVAEPYAHKVLEIAPTGTKSPAESGDDPYALATGANGDLLVGMSTTPLVTDHPGPYTGGGTTLLTGYTADDLATAEPATTVTTLQPVPLTASVISAPVGATLSGTVSFYSGTQLLGKGTLDAKTPDTATYTMPAGTLAQGSHPITAVYSGGGSFPGSTSAVGTIDVTTSILTVPVTGAQVYGGTGVSLHPPRPDPAERGERHRVAHRVQDLGRRLGHSRHLRRHHLELRGPLDHRGQRLLVQRHRL